MKKLLLLFILLSIPVFSQDTKIESKPIEIQSNMQEPIRAANKDIELAQLKKDNIILQLRLILKVPNDFQWDERTFSFIPPPNPSKVEKKEKP